MRGAAVVAGVGESTYYKRGGSPDSEFQLACTAIRNAVADAGLEMRDVDGFVSYMDAQRAGPASSAALGVGDLNFTAQTFGGGGNGAGAAVTIADAAVSAGYAECVVVFRSLAQGQFGRYGQAAGSRRAKLAGRVHRPRTGCSPRPRRRRMQTKRFMHDHGVTQDSAGRDRRWPATPTPSATRGPSATARPLTPRGVPRLALDRRAVPPLRLLPGERRRGGHRRHHGRAGPRPAPASRSPSSPAPTASSTATASARSTSANFPTAHHRHVGRTLWAARRASPPADVQVAQFYENFTGPVLMAITEMGFCEPDEIDDFVGRRQHPVARRRRCRSTPAAATSARPTSTASATSSRRCARCVASRPARSTTSSCSLSVSGPGYAPGQRRAVREALMAEADARRLDAAGDHAVQRGLVHVGVAGDPAVHACAPRCSTRPRRSATCCGSMTFDHVTLAPRGTVASYTVIHYAAHRALADAVPYTVVLVSLDDAPQLRVVGDLVDGGDGRASRSAWPSCRLGRAGGRRRDGGAAPPVATDRAEVRRRAGRARPAGSTTTGTPPARSASGGSWSVPRGGRRRCCRRRSTDAVWRPTRPRRSWPASPSAACSARLSAPRCRSSRRRSPPMPTMRRSSRSCARSSPDAGRGACCSASPAPGRTSPR